MRPNNPGNGDWNTVILNVYSEPNLILFKGDSVTIVSHSHSAWVCFSEHTRTHTGVVCSLPSLSPPLCYPEHLRPRSWWSCSVSRVCGLHPSSARQQHVGDLRLCCVRLGVCRYVCVFLHLVRQNHSFWMSAQCLSPVHSTHITCKGITNSSLLDHYSLRKYSNCTATFKK